jgi:hypothetical protein
MLLESDYQTSSAGGTLWLRGKVSGLLQSTETYVQGHPAAQPGATKQQVTVSKPLADTQSCALSL